MKKDLEVSNKMVNFCTTENAELDVSETKRLVTDDTWENKFKKHNAKYQDERNLLRRIFFKITGGYSSQEDFKEDFLYKSFLPKKGKVVEVGGGEPSKLIKKFWKRNGLEPFIIEISPSGCETARRKFKEEGLIGDRVISADFLDKNFQSKHFSEFDVVYSRGLIEHFYELDEVIYNHFNICKPGGSVVIIIPNMKGLFYRLPLLLFNRKTFEEHNITMMNKKSFNSIFEKPYIEKRYCDFLGTINIQSAFIKRKQLGKKIQGLVDLILLPLLKLHDIKTQTFSPYLIFIGQKK